MFDREFYPVVSISQNFKVNNLVLQERQSENCSTKSFAGSNYVTFVPIVLVRRPRPVMEGPSLGGRRPRPGCWINVLPGSQADRWQGRGVDPLI